MSRYNPHTTSLSRSHTCGLKRCSKGIEGDEAGNGCKDFVLVEELYLEPSDRLDPETIRQCSCTMSAEISTSGETKRSLLTGALPRPVELNVYLGPGFA